jgi:hypothetical protein
VDHSKPGSNSPKFSHIDKKTQIAMPNAPIVTSTTSISQISTFCSLFQMQAISISSGIFAGAAKIHFSFTGREGLNLATLLRNLKSS